MQVQRRVAAYDLPILDWRRLCCRRGGARQDYADRYQGNEQQASLVCYDLTDTHRGRFSLTPTIQQPLISCEGQQAMSASLADNIAHNRLDFPVVVKQRPARDALCLVDKTT